MSILAGYGNKHRAIRQEHDYYATEPKAIELLLRQELFSENVWECSCGEGNLSEVLKEWGYNVYSTDLIDRGYQDEQMDFLTSNIKFNGDIITNPPFKHATQFVKKALDSVPMGNKVAMFLKINYLSGQERYREIYSKYPPYRVYVFTGRVGCSKNNTEEGFKSKGMDYVWMIWEKGMLAPTELRWIKS